MGGFGGELRYRFGEGPLAVDSAFLVSEFISSRGETVYGILGQCLAGRCARAVSRIDHAAERSATTKSRLRFAVVTYPVASIPSFYQ
jgi:hypothetical protein